MLKLNYLILKKKYITPAAFGRLCVETLFNMYKHIVFNPAAFGRLCVETRLAA